MTARALFLAAALLWLGAGATAYAAGTQPSYATPEQGFDALVAAVRTGKPDAIERVLGPGSTKLVVSGDAVADRNGRASFLAAFTGGHKIERPSDDKAVLVIGAEDWPMPIPLRGGDGAWRFDARAGAEEILDRRIGRNELAAIETCRAAVEAERDYASQDHGSGANEYARKFASTPGKEDGLYWPAAAGAAQSPLGPQVAAARAEGYGGRHTPYHGYYFKILTRQGAHASGGARDYVVKGHMIGGFALLAYPAKYGDSGIMTFIVDGDGTVREANLGAQTIRFARAMTVYDPDESWKPVAAAAAAKAP